MLALAAEFLLWGLQPILAGASAEIISCLAWANAAGYEDLFHDYLYDLENNWMRCFALAEQAQNPIICELLVTGIPLLKSRLHVWWWSA